MQQFSSFCDTQRKFVGSAKESINHQTTVRMRWMQMHHMLKTNAHVPSDPLAACSVL